jgi:hypothetical protein
MPQPAPLRRSRASRWLWGVGTILLVAATGLATWQVTRGHAPLSGTGPGAGDDAGGPGTQPARLTAEHDYYLHVKLIELTERRPDGKAWDSVGGSGPDIRFMLTWRHNVIWKSSEKPDTLIGSWDLMKVDVRQMITSGGPTDLGELINAPLIHYTRGETVALKVWDEDTVGSDDAGTIPIKLDELSPGENTLVPGLSKTMAVKRVVVALIDRRTPVPELLNTISNR